MNSIKISIPSILDNIKIIESFIDNAKEKYQINDDIYGNIMISVTECVSNSIIHGNKMDASKSVDLAIEFYDEQIRVIIEDEGIGFDYENLQDPTAPENLEKIGGRGVFIIKHLCDEVLFENKGNKVSLTFYLN
ncbi:ATP-binding protein [Penaeicola halotolerans]|uniref:ATP-binding protein n=1 Tax=Penaeicola halotolerans TaxID=2793196 RepID=UPI001CF81DD1|nr:ATP-binding protein [Penaeicola halotolerans]